MSRETGATGEKGEERAAQYLMSQGCEIVARNWRANPGEIDLVARCPIEDGDFEWAFVEVRTRHGRTGLGEESISARKAASMIQAAYAYMEADGIDPEVVDWRIDLVTVTLQGGRVVTSWAKGAVDE